MAPAAPTAPRAHLEEPGVQQQGVGSLCVVLVADVQVLQLVQVPGSKGTVHPRLAAGWGAEPGTLPLRPPCHPLPTGRGQLGARDPSPPGDAGVPGAPLT